MKKLIFKIFIFVIPILLVLFFMPVKKRLLYQGLTDDCFNHAIWIYDRIYSNTKSIDIVFLGSSHTINAIDDKLIESELAPAKTTVANMGYCRLGANLNHVLLKELIKKKQLKTLVIEVREDEDRYSHPIFPYIADGMDVICANALFNRDYLTNCYQHFYYKLEVVHNLMLNQTKNTEINTADYGFAAHPDTAKASFLASIKLKRSEPEVELSPLERNFHMHFSRVYLEKIHELCVQHNISMYFLYLPSYGCPYQKPKEYNTYIHYGKILFPPNSIMDNTNFWFDENHLNTAGANVFSMWLAATLKAELLKK